MLKTQSLLEWVFKKTTDTKKNKYCKYILMCLPEKCYIKDMFLLCCYFNVLFHYMLLEEDVLFHMIKVAAQRTLYFLNLFNISLMGKFILLNYHLCNK